jgi:protein-L-isoaspartate(D-aspartate) O-methyltransferase
MSKPTPDLDALRLKMVQDQLGRRDITDPRVLEAMRTVPRHLFVPQDLVHMAYWDGPLAIGEGQTISQPYIVALMTQLMHLQGDEKVLEIGCGSGYQAAVLALLARSVLTIERHAVLADRARERLKALGYDNVRVHIGDGSVGMPAEAPFDGILITAGAPDIPLTLKEQVAPGGRIVAPVGRLDNQVLEVLEHRGRTWHVERSIPVMFVPLIGVHGWDEREYDRGRWFT